MAKILEFIAKNTDGHSYKSFKYCFDATSMPQIEYDDKKEILIKKRGETDKLTSTRNLKNHSQSDLIKKKPLFHFFLDGSRRTYKVDDLRYGKRLYPAVAGQIGIACCERENKDSFKPYVFDRNVVVSIPSIANSGSHSGEFFFNNLLKKLNEQEYLQKRNIQFSKILHYSDREGDEYEKKAIATIQDEMIDKEKRLVVELAKKGALNYDAYLLKDGSLEYGKMPNKEEFGELSKIRANYSCVVGVSKAFNPETLSKSNPNISKIIADLKLYDRTPAMKYSTERVGTDVWFSVWYLRIRDVKYGQSPYDGVVKIEKILVSDKEIEYGLETDEVDNISAQIINESFPVCYGQDSRWAKHLYPIYLTEQYAKSKYISDLHFINLF
ncbi:MAG: hypothetical protein KDC90_03400 [Ignavibacteriae bacterium]|nr:hypothetical protein [Ignavibacteriota bacterium]